MLTPIHQLQKMREYYTKNRERILANKKLYDKENKGWIRSKRRTRYHESEQIKRNTRNTNDEWYERNRESYLEKRRTKYRIAHGLDVNSPVRVHSLPAEEAKRREKAYRQRYKKLNPEIWNLRTHARRAGKENGKKVNKGDIKAMLVSQGLRCANIACRKSILRSYHIDHIIPISKGGRHEIENIQLLCPSCNFRKNAKLPDVWAKENGVLF